MAGIFISYRRDDAPGVAGRLFDRLTRDFPQRDLFMDVDTMRPGIDFVKQIDDQVSKCDVMIAVIGPDWLNAQDDKGRRKLDLQRDFVRLEVASALKRDIPVIPLLVNGTAMPSEDDLPDDLKTLPHRHALELRHTRFSADSEAVIRALRTIMPRRRRWPWIAGVASVLAIGCLVALSAVLWRSGERAPAEISGAKSNNSLTDQAPRPPASSKPIMALAQPSPTPSTRTDPLPAAAPQLSTPSKPEPDAGLCFPWQEFKNGICTVKPSQAPAPAVFNGRKVALVIGNAKYPDADAPLKSPVNDATDLSAELKRAGFDVEYAGNLSGAEMKLALDRFYKRTGSGAAALLFFSGFGIQSARQTYLIPVDAQIWTESDVRRDGIALEPILGTLNDRGAAVKIVVLDASRRNPYERRFRPGAMGLAPVIAPNGSLVMYSAALSSVVADNGGDRGLFVTELVKELRYSGSNAEEAFNRARVAVTRASRGDQVPWLSSSMSSDFSFSPLADAK